MRGWRPSTKEISDPQWFASPPVRDFVVHVWADWNDIDRSMDALLATSEISRFVFSLDTEREHFWPFLREAQVINVPALLVFRNGTYLRTIQNQRPDFLLAEATKALAEARA